MTNSNLLTLFALGVKGSKSEGPYVEEFSLSRMLTSRGFKKPVRLVRGVELSTADMRAAFALRLTTEGLMLRRSGMLAAFLGLGPAPVLLALGPAKHYQHVCIRNEEDRARLHLVMFQEAALQLTHLGCSCPNVGKEVKLVQLGVRNR